MVGVILSCFLLQTYYGTRMPSKSYLQKKSHANKNPTQIEADKLGRFLCPGLRISVKQSLYPIYLS